MPSRTLLHFTADSDGAVRQAPIETNLEKAKDRDTHSSGCWPLGVAGGVASWREVSACQETDCYPPIQTCESERRRERERERDKQRSCVLHRRCVVNQGERKRDGERDTKQKFTPTQPSLQTKSMLAAGRTCPPDMLLSRTHTHTQTLPAYLQTLAVCYALIPTLYILIVSLMCVETHTASIQTLSSLMNLIGFIGFSFKSEEHIWCFITEKNVNVLFSKTNFI